MAMALQEVLTQSAKITWVSLVLRGGSIAPAAEQTDQHGNSRHENENKMK